MYVLSMMGDIGGCGGAELGPAAMFFSAGLVVLEAGALAVAVAETVAETETSV